MLRKSRISERYQQISEDLSQLNIFNELIKYKTEITQLLSNNVLEKEKLKPVAMVKLGKKLYKWAIRALINKIVNAVLEEETAKPNF